MSRFSHGPLTCNPCDRSGSSTSRNGLHVLKILLNTAGGRTAMAQGSAKILDPLQASDILKIT